jgi:hypothetical protein
MNLAQVLTRAPCVRTKPDLSFFSLALQNSFLLIRSSTNFVFHSKISTFFCKMDVEEDNINWEDLLSFLPAEIAVSCLRPLPMRTIGRYARQYCIVECVCFIQDIACC